jgi:hypothetical protein
MSEHTDKRKECRICKELLPLEEFGALGASSDGLNSKCKACNRYASAKSYKKRALNPKPRVEPRIALPLKEKNLTLIKLYLGEEPSSGVKIPFISRDIALPDEFTSRGEIEVSWTDYKDARGGPSFSWKIEFWWRDKIQGGYLATGSLEWGEDFLATQLTDMRMIIILEEHNVKRSE